MKKEQRQKALGELSERKKSKYLEVESLEKKLIKHQSDACKNDDEIINLQKKINKIILDKNENLEKIEPLRAKLEELRAEMYQISSEETNINQMPDEED